LDHVLPYLKKGARVVAFGAKLSHSRRVRPLNPLLRLLTQTLLPASSAAVDDRPWRLLDDRTGKLHVEERLEACCTRSRDPCSTTELYRAACGSRRFDCQLEIVPVDVDLA
jgi:hypothetical protein